jgi:pantothenate kinase
MPPSSSQHTRRIRLPNQKDTINQFGIDIGGSLAKIVYYEECQPHDDDCFDYNHRRPGGRLCFAKFETSQIHECLDFIIEKVCIRERSKNIKR